MILVAAPVLGRPQNAAPLAASLLASGADARLLFLCSPGDEAEIDACRATGADTVIVPWSPKHGDYARKINYAVTWSTEPWILMGADDLEFFPGWDVAALQRAAVTGALVIGTQDGGNASVLTGDHATHPLVAREYVERFGTIDERGKLLHEGYDHNYVDDELISTAKARGVWAFCHDAKVMHLHPNWGKGVQDATYEKGMRNVSEDSRLFALRQSLWRS